MSGSLGAMRILAIVGPTAAGKTELALRAAEAGGGEILICDAYQLRAGLPILTAKPTEEDLARAPHHLVGALPLDEPATAAAFVELAEAALVDLSARGKAAILCGGTGLYLRALAQGLFPGPGADARFREALRAEAQAHGVPALHDRLAAVDPEAAARIMRGDYVRIERALEVHHLTGRPISALQAESRARPPRHDVLRVALDPGREPLRARIAARARAMIERGVAGEVRAVAAAGPLRHPPLGYDLVEQHLAGALDEDALCERLTQQTAQYARRQRTWMKNEPDVRWYEGPDAAPLPELLSWLRG